MNLTKIVDTIHDILIFFYYQLEFILEIIILLFEILSTALVVIMLKLIILYITVYKYEKLRLILRQSIEILEDWYLYGYWKLLYLIYAYIVIKVLQALIICTILILP